MSLAAHPLGADNIVSLSSGVVCEGVGCGFDGMYILESITRIRCALYIPVFGSDANTESEFIRLSKNHFQDAPLNLHTLVITSLHCPITVKPSVV